MRSAKQPNPWSLDAIRNRWRNPFTSRGLAANGLIVLTNANQQGDAEGESPLQSGPYCDPALRFDCSTDRKLLSWLRTITADWPEAARDLEATIDENPGRISRAFRQLLSGYSLAPRDVLKVALDVSADGHHGLVAANRIPFLSFCAHHFLPFCGSMDIVYEPDAQIIGIGKFPRLVNCRSRRFQLQELLVKELSEDIMAYANAKGVFIRSSAQHTCVCYRGPDQASVVNTATYSLGSLNQPHRFEEIVMAMATPIK